MSVTESSREGTNGKTALVWPREDTHSACTGLLNPSTVDPYRTHTLVLTVMFASNMNSSTSEFVSLSCLTSTSRGSCCSSSMSSWNRTSGLASVSAPFSMRRALSTCGTTIGTQREMFDIQ